PSASHASRSTCAVSHASSKASASGAASSPSSAPANRYSRPDVSTRTKLLRTGPPAIRICPHGSGKPRGNPVGWCGGMLRFPTGELNLAPHLPHPLTPSPQRGEGERMTVPPAVPPLLSAESGPGGEATWRAFCELQLSSLLSCWRRAP